MYQYKYNTNINTNATLSPTIPSFSAPHPSVLILNPYHQRWYNHHLKGKYFQYNLWQNNVAQASPIKVSSLLEHFGWETFLSLLRGRHLLPPFSPIFNPKVCKNSKTRVYTDEQIQNTKLKEDITCGKLKMLSTHQCHLSRHIVQLNSV